MIEVTRTSAFAFEVEVEVVDDAEPSRHLVAAAPEMLEHLAPGHAAEAVIEAAFRFLLDREPKQSILPEFDFTVIASYFPEFEAELPRYLNRRDPAAPTISPRAD